MASAPAPDAAARRAAVMNIVYRSNQGLTGYIRKADRLKDEDAMLRALINCGFLPATGEKPTEAETC
jgi:hypothetical protein